MTAARSLYRLPESLRQDLDQLRQMTEQFRKGEIPAPRYQAFRVPLGIYEQRESGTYMLRVRLPAGMLLPDHMRAVAAAAEAWGDGTLHLTSRQDIQIHGVHLDGICPAVNALDEAGLSTKGGGGNTVRNIAACPHAGVCPDEVFDVTPHVVALTEFLLPDPLSFQLPRKYKIAFSGCGKDCAATTVSDLGFVARKGSEAACRNQSARPLDSEGTLPGKQQTALVLRDGVDGFAVYVAGGMGAVSRVGTLLDDFVPASQVRLVAEAIKRVFDKHGNRKNKHRARLRFLLEELGLDAFRDRYRRELAELRVTPSDPAPGSNYRPSAPPPRIDLKGFDSVGFGWWRKANVRPQKQSGYHIVELSPLLGVLDVATLRRLADLVEAHGERMLRATNLQGAVLRWVAEAELPAVYTDLSALGLAASRPIPLRRLVACAGASTCRLGICLSRGLARAIADAVTRSEISLEDETGDLSIHISGCPNACGRHPVAQIGFFGAARRVRGHLVPHYVVQLGGRVEEGKTVLASGSKAIPARRVPAFLVELLKVFRDSPQYPDFHAFLESGGRDAAERLAAAHADVPDFEDDKNSYFDWDAQEVFSLAGRGPGECGAGVFDLIEVDLASAAEALAAKRLFAATALAARALLVTRGEQADNELQSLTLFRRHFIEPGLIPPELHQLIDKALGVVAAADPAASFDASPDDVAGLLAAVRKLYESMGPSLRVVASTKTAPPVAAPSLATEPAVDLTQDFRGVACPLNYVKTKMALGRLKSGQVLLALLDEQGSRNVPASAAGDGHEVVSVARDADHWRVIIRKGGVTDQTSRGCVAV